MSTQLVFVPGPRWILHAGNPWRYHPEGEPCVECEKLLAHGKPTVVESVDHEHGRIVFGSGDKP